MRVIFDFSVRTFVLPGEVEKTVIYIQPSELVLIFHQRGRKLFFRHETNTSNMPARCKSRGEKKGKKEKEITR